ncbi:hypothetical protein EV426DRAFT_424875 [Tirmania nivea]|nr:hypothetical protein EV426DRAFT_424875 [Tirmania nivea]
MLHEPMLIVRKLLMHNQMTTRNLAVVFAPTLMWHIDSDREMQDMHEKNNAIQFLIENGEAIFFS